MRVAIVTHTFPPSSRANAKRPSYVVNALLAEGHQVEVFTNVLGCDQEESLVIENGLSIHNLSDPITSLAARIDRWPILRRIFFTLLSGLCWPDIWFLWAEKISRILAGRKDFDLVLVFIIPSSLYLCSRFDKLIDKRWCFDLQESVTPQFRRFPKRSILQRKLLPRLEMMERTAMRAAGSVIFTAKSNCDAYLEAGLVDEDKAHHIPYFYDDRVFKDNPEIEVSAGFEIRYFGTFDWSGSRSPNSFLKSLKQFLENKPEARSVTKFSFYGGWLKEHSSLIDELGMEDVVEIREAVGYNEYLNLVRSAPVLLLVVAQEHNLFMPSKIVDYFGAQRPILGFVPEGSEMSQVLAKAGMSSFVCDQNDVAAGAACIENLWAHYQGENGAPFQGDTEYWSSANLIPRYLETLGV